MITNTPIMKILAILLTTIIAVALSVNKSNAQDNEQSAAQANNPLANMTALNFHDYYVAKLSNAESGSYMNTGWIRFAKPFAKGKLLLRASAPLSTMSIQQTYNGTVTNTTSNGLGDVKCFRFLQFYF